MGFVKSKTPLNFANSNPDDMTAGGLADDFDATVVWARYAPYKYQSGEGDIRLCAILEFEPDDPEVILRPEAYKAGDLKHWRPSDGKSSYLDDDYINWADADEDEKKDLEGTHVASITGKTVLSSSSKWAEFMEAAKECGYPAELMNNPDIRTIEGHRFHFNRLPMRERPGLDLAGKTILVPTQYLGEAKGGKKAAPKASAKAAKVEEDEDEDNESAEVSDELQSAVVKFVVAQLVKQDPLELDKLKIAAIRDPKLKEDRKEVGDLFNLEKSDFLTSHEDKWLFNAKKRMLSTPD